MGLITKERISIAFDRALLSSQNLKLGSRTLNEASRKIVRSLKIFFRSHITELLSSTPASQAEIKVKEATDDAFEIFVSTPGAEIYIITTVEPGTTEVFSLSSKLGDKTLYFQFIKAPDFKRHAKDIMSFVQRLRKNCKKSYAPRFCQ